MSCTQHKQLASFPRARVQKEWFRYFNDHKDFRNEGTLHLFSLMALYSYADFRSNTRVIDEKKYNETPGQWICKVSALPRILRAHSKAHAMELMNYFRDAGFLDYEMLDEESGILRYTIADWKKHCTHLEYNEYCDTYLGGDSRMVIVRILPRGKIRRCPLMRNQKCMVHKVKPSVCALFPIGRAIKAKAGDTADTMNYEVEYFIQEIHCGAPSEPHTVREWLSDFDYLLDDEFFKKWTMLIRYYGSAIKKILKSEDEETVNLVAKCILSVLYLNYRTDEPFHPQLEENDRKLREVISDVLNQIESQTGSKE